MTAISVGARHRRRHATLHQRRMIVGITAASGCAAALLPGAATGLAPADALLRAAFAAAVASLASRAHRWALLFIAATATIFANAGMPRALAIIALVIAFIATTRERDRVLNAAVGALAVLALLRQAPSTVFGLSTALTAGAVTPVLISGWRQTPRRSRRRVRRALLALAGVIALAVAGVAFSVYRMRTFAIASQDDADRVMASTERGDRAGAIAALDDLHTHLNAANNALNAPWAWPGRVVPVLGQHLRVLQVGTAEATSVSKAAAETLRAFDPNDIKFIDGRIDIDAIRAAQPQFDVLAASMTHADERIATLDSRWLYAPLRTELVRATNDLHRYAEDTRLAASAAHQLPNLLGASGDRTYVLLFTTPAESRGLGGFVGNWSEIRFSNGKATIAASGRANDLNERLRANPPTLVAPADYVARFGRYNPEIYFQDVTFSPNFPSVAQVVEQLYPAAVGHPIDGVIAIDPYALAGLLQLTGPVTLPDGTSITSSNAVDELLRTQYIDATDNAARKDRLSDLSDAAFNALLAGKLPDARKIADVIGPLVEQRRIALHTVDPAAQQLVLEAGAAGSLPVSHGQDLFMVVHQNSGNNKIDAFLHRESSYDVKIDPTTGIIRATARITLRNDAPATGLPDAIIGSNDRGLPLGTNAMTLSLYSSLGTRGVRINGVEAKPEANLEAGWRVTSVPLQLAPGSTATVEIDLAGVLSSTAAYELTAIPQPSANAETLTVTVNGQQLLLGNAAYRKATSVHFAAFN